MINFLVKISDIIINQVHLTRFKEFCNLFCCRILGSVDPVLLLGGVRDFDLVLSSSGHISTHDFIGCMRNASVDGLDLFHIQPTFTNLTLNTCQRSLEGRCQPNPCQNGGTCVDEWLDLRCQCRAGFTGRMCAVGEHWNHPLFL